MAPDLEHLIELQKIESAIAEARSRMATHPQRLADADLRLSEADRVVTEATEQLKSSQEARRALEKDAAVYQARLAKFKDQLASVKTNREYTAMQHEIETAQKDLGAAEEKVLERMLEADSLTAEVKSAEAARAAQRKLIESEKAELAAELKETEEKLARAVTARDALIKSLEPRLLGLFDQVSKARKGVALCLVTRDGLCTACHVRPSVFQQVRANSGIVQCDSCQRILYYIAPLPPVEPPVTHAP
jgi:predicted  nucleic acid-binding Zn-ribbon protein